MLKVWINNNDNNEILKVGLLILIVMRFLKVWVNDDNNNNKWMLIVWNDNNDNDD